MRRRKVSYSLFSLLVVLFACSGGGGRKGLDAGAASDAGQGVDASLVPGERVDTDGDGVPDGVAVDSNGDGIVDGVDTNGDGVIDAPVPTGALTDSGTASGGNLSLPDGAVPYPVNESGQVLCSGVPCQCSDGLDNDEDGAGDVADPECVAPWDNDESSLATGIPGDNRDDACQDCFFDGNSGSGNDGCRTPSSCLTEGNASSGQGSCNTCEASNRCKNFCRAYTPNGCDCFGCCEVHLPNGTTKNVMLGSSCDINGNDLSNCQACVQNDSCINKCGECELCPGRTVDELPASCFTNPPPPPPPPADGGTSTPPPPVHTCEDGDIVCGAGLPECPVGSLCQLGCCVLSPILF